MPRSGWLALGSAVTAFVALSAGEAAGAAAGFALGSVAALLVGRASFRRVPTGRAVVAAEAARTGAATRGHHMASPAPHDRARTRSGTLLRTVGPLGAGGVLLALRLAVAGSPPQAGLPADDGPWRARIETVSSPRDGQQVATLLLAPSFARLYATLPRFPTVTPGDTVSVDGSVRPPPDDGFGGYLRAAGMAGTLRARELTLLPTPADPGRLLEGSRRGSGDALAAVLPEPEAGLAAGILVGLRDRVDRDLAADFTTAGVSHVVAISGWNIAIVGAVVAALARGLSRRRRAVLTLLAVVAYTAFAGASPSVLRAAVMAAVVLVARESGRAGTAAAALGWAAALLLLADPSMVGDAGFQLSTLATAGLLAWASPLQAALGRHGVFARLPAVLVETLAVSFAAQAATLPVVLLAFGRLSLVAPLVNLAVVPIVAPVMGLAALSLVGGWLVVAGLPMALGTIIALPGWAALTVLVAIVRVSARVPFASIGLEPPASWVAAGLAGVLVAVLGTGRGRAIARSLIARLGRASAGWHRRPAGGSAGRQARAASRPGHHVATPAGRARGASVRLRRVARIWRIVCVAVATSIVAVALVAAARPDGRVVVTILDVGQGDAILVQGDRGSRMLVDGGPDPDRLVLELDEHVPPWDRRIDLVVLTHPHEDHVAGLAGLFERYRIGRVLDTGLAGTGPGYQAWIAGLRSHRIESSVARTGDRLEIDGVRLRVLWPDANAVPRSPPDTGTGVNDVSIVMLGEYGSLRFLLTGDVEEGIDPVLVARGLPTIDLLKVAHHGSRTATSQQELDALRPKVAAVSVGADNSYGHPAASTLRRLLGSGATVFRTDENASISVTLDGVTMSTSVERGGAFDGATASTSVERGGAFVAECSGALLRSLDRAAPYGSLGYHRIDDGTRATRVCSAAALPSPADLVPPPLARRRGDRSLARTANRRPRSQRRSSARRGGRPAARRRQAPACRRCRSPPAPRRGVGGVARTRGPPGAWPGGRRPSGHAARDRTERWLHCVAPPPGGRASRSTDRRLRRQAGRTASRIPCRSLSILGTSLSFSRGPRRGARTRCGRPRGDAAWLGGARTTRLRRGRRGGVSGPPPALGDCCPARGSGPR